MSEYVAAAVTQEHYLQYVTEELKSISYIPCFMNWNAAVIAARRTRPSSGNAHHSIIFGRIFSSSACAGIADANQSDISNDILVRKHTCNSSKSARSSTEH